MRNGVQWAVSRGLLVGVCLCWPACAEPSEHAARDQLSREQVQSQDDAQTVRRAAEQEDAAAQSNLGIMYANGEGVPQDHAEAVQWYRLAADQGHASAQFNLGVMYANAEGVPEDHAEAVRWYRLAADQGHATAQFNLGVRDTNREGVPQDNAEAVRW